MWTAWPVHFFDFVGVCLSSKIDKVSAMSNRAGPLKYSVAWAPHAVMHEVVLNVLFTSIDSGECVHRTIVKFSSVLPIYDRILQLYHLMACMVMGTRQRLAAILNRVARRNKIAKTDGMGTYPTTCRAVR